jgi:outer membrane protein OmpU
MKRIILTTTALVATAGVAAAEVTLTGSAEMGIFGGDGAVGATAFDVETQFHTDIDVTFTLSGETDNGLTFGATIDLDEEGGFAATNGGPEAVFLSGNFGTITMGDTDGAFDWALSEVPAGPGSINDAETEHYGYNGNSIFDGVYDGQILRYDHSIGGFSFAISVELDDAATAASPVAYSATLAALAPSGTGPAGVLLVPATSTDSNIAIGVQYDLNLGGTDLEIGLGYQTYGFTVGATTVDPSIVGLSLATNISGLDVGLNYSVIDWDVPGTLVDETHFAIGVAYSMDALSFGLNYGRYDDMFGLAGLEGTGFGLSVGYDLGGGASILAGYSTSDIEAAGTTFYELNTWSIGLSMSF